MISLLASPVRARPIAMFVAAWAQRRIALGAVGDFARCSLSIASITLASAYAVRSWISFTVSPFVDGIATGIYVVDNLGKNLCSSSIDAGDGCSNRAR